METNRPEYPAEWYDEVYHGDHVKKVRYHLPAEKSSYFPLWNQAVGWIKQLPHPSVFDLGCGTGQFMDLAYRSGIVVTGGVDFSSEAIKMCQERIPTHAILFSVQNLNQRPYTWLRPSSAITLFEVLEHILDDLSVLEALPSGQNIIFSVPSFKCENHVRLFQTPKEIEDRYAGLLNIKSSIPFRKKHVIWLCNAEKKIT